MIYIITITSILRPRVCGQLQSRPHTIVEGVDTRSDQNADVHKDRVTTQAWDRLLLARSAKTRREHRDLTNGAIGCYLSHLKVWSLVQKGEYAVVFENDAQILDPNYFDRLMLPPTDTWDILLLGFIGGDKKKAGWQRVTRFQETHAYVITAKAIRKLLPHMLPISCQLDWRLSELAHAGIIKIVGHCPSIVVQDHNLTSIQTWPVKKMKRIDDPNLSHL